MARIVDPEKMRELENHQEMLKKIEQLSIKRQTILNAFNGDAKAYLANHQAKMKQMAQLEEEIKNQEKVIAALDDRILEIDSMLQSL
ncbi:unnamed protein product [Onchocerca flexuosa]|uniref:Transposase n=1 Tax=Onchocerca flexuosa TaxID=387005 RepID=A0A183HB76_9BILA|nr:unnamed protein product [Onchocerca flexuosa]